MRVPIHALAVVALVVPIVLGAQPRPDAPACRADLNGDQLTTIIEFSDGYAVEAPWRVLWNRPASLEDGSEGVAVGATLNRIVEVDPATGNRQTTPFPEPIETTFEGQNETALVHRAAQIWCLTVIKAQEKSKSEAPQEQQSRARAVAG